MRNFDEPKPQYLDLSYGWQDRGQLARLHDRKRRRRKLLVLVSLLVVTAVIYLFWRLP